MLLRFGLLEIAWDVAIASIAESLVRRVVDVVLDEPHRPVSNQEVDATSMI